MNIFTTTRASAGSRSKRSIRVAEARVIAALTAVLLLGLPCPGQAATSCSTPSFAAPADFLVGGSSGSVAVGDFDHDGNMDLITNVSMLFGDGAGGFGAAINLSDLVAGSNDPSSATPVFIAVGDFDNDMNLDVAMADYSGGKVWVVTGDGQGHFGIANSYPVGAQAFFVIVADFNNDLKADLAVMNKANSGQVSVLLGNGDGTFGAATGFPAGPFPSGAAVGDFNGDGRQDLAVANLTANTVSVLLGNGDGTFGAPNAFPTGSDPFFVAVGNFDADLKLDLAVTNVSGGSVSVLSGDGLGGFAPHTDFTVGTQPVAAAVADVNGDGRQDLVVANNVSQSLSVLLGTGTGSFFSPAVDFPVGHTPGFVNVGDLNHDGKTDLVVADSGTNVVSVLFNACGNPVHDTVVLPVKPVVVTIPVGKSSVTKKLSVKVRNADPANTPAYNVKLVVDDSDCGVPGTVASTPDFFPIIAGAQNSAPVGPGRTKTAKVVLTIDGGAFTSFNRKAPHRCTLWFTSSADVTDFNGDPTLSNNVLPVEVSVTDLNDTDQTAVHETTIDSLKPVVVNIFKGKSSKTMTVRPKVGNADIGEVPPGDVIFGAALDGTCPAGTLSAVDFSSLSGIQASATVAGGAKKSGTLKVTATDALCTPNRLAPQRCIATVSATGPGGDTDGTNNTTHVVIDMVDRNDAAGVCVP